MSEHQYIVRVATSQPDLESIFRLRHQVFCEDYGFEGISQDGLETDRYDWRSTNLMVMVPEVSQSPVGCIRIVRPGSTDSLRLPCEDLIGRSLFTSADGAYAEASRLAVARIARLGGREATGTHGHWNLQVFLHLNIGALANAALLDLDTLCMLVEPRLRSYMEAWGLKCEKRAGPVRHRGTREVVVLNVRESISALKPIYRRKVMTTAVALSTQLGDCGHVGMAPGLANVVRQRGPNGKSLIR